MEVVRAGRKNLPSDHIENPVLICLRFLCCLLFEFSSKFHLCSLSSHQLASHTGNEIALKEQEDQDDTGSQV
jgi:hypothetical protein